MAEVNQHDIIVHYANGALRYVSKVLQAAIETTKPATLKEEDWSTDGRMVKVEYHELTPQIPIKKISEATLQLDISQGPINSSGGVKQGYLFRLTPDALGIIQNSQPETKWPDFAIMPKTPPVIKNPEYPLLQVALETSFPEDQLAHWVHAIERKGQAIVYGPPGTGKTYIAEKLALHLIGGGDGFQEVVQFHPAYSYEDFIQGIRPKARPDGSLDYPVVAGRFLEFCDRYKSRQGRCVLIIDEINRANLSQVFGELMYLLEYRNREVPLASGGIFQIPTNIRLIGTMNTADRSIALVDHALRRRFAFLRLYPNYEVLSKYHANTGFPVENLIQTLRHLNNQIGDPHYEVGISFFLRKDLESQIEDIWGMEIEPYLEEYFFDQPEKVGEFRWQKVHKKIFP
jgi:5-methylcytosine-specific restriction protein B